MQVCDREVPSPTVSVLENSDVERDIGARVYDVLETQIGELDFRRSHQQPMVRQSRGPMGPWGSMGRALLGGRGCGAWGKGLYVSEGPILSWPP